MANLFAWASIGENGKAVGGIRGDQTGKEVKVGYYYNFGQNIVIRFRDVEKGRKLGKIAKWLANSNILGYNQHDRESFYNECQKRGWNWKVIKRDIKKGKFPPCNTDCSAFAAACINIVMEMRVVACFTTGTMYHNCIERNANLFKSYLISKMETIGWRKGDMPLKAYKHVIINV